MEVHNSIFNITEENNNFEPYIFPVSKIGGIAFKKVKDEIEKDFDVSDITATDLHDEITGPFIIEEYSKQVPKRMKSDKSMINFSNLS